MKIGCPKEIKPQEFRVGMTPDAARDAVNHGHDVTIETKAGVGAGFADADYVAAGAQIVDQAEKREEMNRRRAEEAVEAARAALGGEPGPGKAAKP